MDRQAVGIRYRLQQLSPNFLESVAQSPSWLGSPAPSQTPQGPTSTNPGNPIWAILAGLAGGLMAGVVMVGFLAMWWRRRAKERDANAIGSTEGLLEGPIQPKNKRFNSSEIARITDNFRKELGKGGFGTVYYGALQDGTEVAVKLLTNTSSTITLKQFCAEAELLMRIHHVNLVTLIGYCDELANMALV